MLVREPLYVHHGRPGVRVPPGTTALSPNAERGAMQRFADALSGDPAAPNELCPQHPANRAVLLRAELRAGPRRPHGDREPARARREWRARADAAPQRARARTSRGQRDAIVVLGMLSQRNLARSRARSTCAAPRPADARRRRPRLGINPKGFWESEASPISTPACSSIWAGVESRTLRAADERSAGGGVPHERARDPRKSSTATLRRS
jgi:hypothetical protein